MTYSADTQTSFCSKLYRCLKKYKRQTFIPTEQIIIISCWNASAFLGGASDDYNVGSSNRLGKTIRYVHVLPSVPPSTYLPAKQSREKRAQRTTTVIIKIKIGRQRWWWWWTRWETAGKTHRPSSGRSRRAMNTAARTLFCCCPCMSRCENIV